MPVDTAKTVDLNYIKSQTFKEISCDGIVGGPTPHNKIWLSFYTERFPLPRIVRHAIVESAPGEYAIDPAVEPQQLEGKSGIIRNVECGVYMSIETATELRDWLDRQIKTIRGDENASAQEGS